MQRLWFVGSRESLWLRVTRVRVGFAFFALLGRAQAEFTVLPALIKTAWKVGQFPSVLSRFRGLGLRVYDEGAPPCFCSRGPTDRRAVALHEFAPKPDTTPAFASVESEALGP